MPIALVFYLFFNMKALGEEGVALEVLFVSVLFGLLLLTFDFFKKKITFPRSTIILMVFFFYYVLRVFISLGDLGVLKAYTLSTDGGLLLFYCLGAIISINLSTLKLNLSEQQERLFYILYFIFALIFLLLLTDSFATLHLLVRDDIFLVSLMDDAYQRPGAFLVVGFFVYTFLFSFLFFLKDKESQFYWFKYISLMAFILFCISAISGMLFAQLFGSNSAFVCIGGMLFATTILFIFDTTDSLKLCKALDIGFVWKFFLVALLALVIDAIFFMGGVVVLDLDLNQLRIFGYGAIYNDVEMTSSISSISSRMELWGNFVTHFKYAPIFGNMFVDKITTGEGTYVHGFMGSLVTHLGLVGVFLFVFYLFVSIKENVNVESKKYLDIANSMYYLMLFSGIFFIACVAVFFVWVPMWFLLGMVFPPIFFRNKEGV